MNNSTTKLWLPHPKDKVIAQALLDDGFVVDSFYLDSEESLDALGEVEGWLIARLCYTGVVLCFPPKGEIGKRVIPFGMEEPCLSKDYIPGSDEEDWLDDIINPWQLPCIGLDTLISLKELIEGAAHAWELSCGQQLALSLDSASLMQKNAIGIWGGIG